MNATTAEPASRRKTGRHRDGTSAGEAACRACGEANRAAARYCQNCGRSLAGGGWFDAQTLTVLGAAVIALVAIGALFASVIDTGGMSGTEPAVTATARTAPAPSGQPPDLSTMSPREAADRLFNRVMMADEQGDGGEVAQFAPMAVAAYERIGTLDLDGIFHLGLIHAAAGDIGRAEDAVERLRATVPDHLLASFLEHRLATALGDQAKAERAIERFRAGYEQEIEEDRPEYQHHRRLIDQFSAQHGAASGAGG